MTIDDVVESNNPFGVERYPGRGWVIVHVYSLENAVLASYVAQELCPTPTTMDIEQAYVWKSRILAKLWTAYFNTMWRKA